MFHRAFAAAAFAAGVCFVGPPAMAHHSFAMFDIDMSLPKTKSAHIDDAIRRGLVWL